MTNITLPKKPKIENLSTIKMLTKGQSDSKAIWDSNKDILMCGSAGTGKSLLALYFGLEQVLATDNHYNKVIIIRTAVPTQDMGFLPGEIIDKEDPYNAPYKSIVNHLFNSTDAWDKVIQSGQVQFMTTSYIRGITLDDAVIFVDEIQNMRYDELRSTITRLGESTRLILAGDTKQTDLQGREAAAAIRGFNKFKAIFDRMKNTDQIEFKPSDIVRSGRVRDFIITEELYDKEISNDSDNER